MIGGEYGVRENRKTDILSGGNPPAETHFWGIENVRIVD